jgi:tetratricopeptide (TPR) repeat protein
LSRYETSRGCYRHETDLARPWNVRAILILILGLRSCFAQEAETLIEAGHWKRARALVEQRLHDAPDDPNATFLWSQIRNAFGDRSSPLPLAEKAVRLAPGVARYHRQLAEVLGVTAQHANVFQQALLARRFRKEIDTALQLDARDVQALRDLLEFYLLAPGIIGGDAAKAETVARRVAEIDACEGLLASARIAEYRKDPPEQLRLLRRAAEMRPASYKALMAAAHRDEASAEALARAAIAIDSGRAEAYCVLARILAHRADWNALDALLAAAAEAVPDDAAPYYRAAATIAADGRDPVRAERYLHVYRSQEPEGNHGAGN